MIKGQFVALGELSETGGAASRAEFEERFGRDCAQPICHQLRDRPQVNFDGKILGCCRNFWGDFGSNAFTEGLTASVNSEKMTYARKMLRGDAASRADIPCATCEIYLGMQRRGKWLERSARSSSKRVKSPAILRIRTKCSRN
jgi:hypothetical protein